MKPQISIIIPTYNNAPLLKGALNSVTNQTFQDFEVIVIDNCSMDNTKEVVESFGSERIKLMNIRNEGVIAKSRNLGVKVSEAPLIAFLDSDDLWHPNKLEKCLEIFEQDRGIILVCHDENVTVDGKIIRANICGPYTEPMYDNLLFESNCLSPSAVVVKRDSLLSVGGFNENPNFAGAEDWDLWMRLATIGKFYFLHEVLGEYKIHTGRYSYNIEVHTRHSLNVAEHHFNQLSADELREHKREIKRVKSNILFGGGWENLQRGDFFRAKNWFKDGIRVYPFDFKNYIGFALALFRIHPPQGVIKIMKAITGK